MLIKLKKPLILASKSPRRIELLKEIGLEFDVDPAENFQEQKEKGDLTPEALAIQNAEGKAREIAKKHEDAYVLGVDTIGAYQHHVLNKPEDLDDAKRILKILNGTTHEVISGICLIDTGNSRKITYAEKTFVTFGKMSKEEVEAYLKSGESMDKAAAFAIQGLGSLFIEKIDGDYFNVVGLPIYRLYQMLKELGEKLV